MTGQVKEDILSRFGELGVRVSDGTLGFDPTILHVNEFFNRTQAIQLHKCCQSNSIN